MDRQRIMDCCANSTCLEKSLELIALAGTDHIKVIDMPVTRWLNGSNHI
jgi:hypothetical protein